MTVTLGRRRLRQGNGVYRSGGDMPTPSSAKTDVPCFAGMGVLRGTPLSRLFRPFLAGQKRTRAEGEYERTPRRVTALLPDIDRRRAGSASCRGMGKPMPYNMCVAAQAAPPAGVCKITSLDNKVVPADDAGTYSPSARVLFCLAKKGRKRRPKRGDCSSPLLGISPLMSDNPSLVKGLWAGLCKALLCSDMQ